MADCELLEKITAGVVARLSDENGPIAPNLPAKIAQAVCVDLQSLDWPTDEQIVAVIDRHVRFSLFYHGLAIDKASSPQTPST